MVCTSSIDACNFSERNYALRAFEREAAVSDTASNDRLWGLGNELGRVLGQRRDTPDNKKWSGRWESNPDGQLFKAYEIRLF